MKKMIPLSIPDVGKEEINAIQEVLDSGWLTHGNKNIEFEENFARYIGVDYAVSLNSCTSALFLTLKALGITGEVILPSFTFVASANAVVTAGATPVFVDVEYDTCNLDADKIEKNITKDTQAIMPVHYAGQSCEMDKVIDIASKYNLKIIEDSAQTIGGMYKGKKTGSFGIGCFSFFPTKNMTTGEGGMITTNDSRLGELIRLYAAHGIPKDTFKREKDKRFWIRSAVLPGYNFRMSNILAAMGVIQLKKVDAMNQRRRENAFYLNKHLNSDYLDLPVEGGQCQHVYQMYTVKLKKIDRNEFLSYLRKRGIGASVHFDPPAHLNDYYSKQYNSKFELPVTERLSKSIVTLPLYPQFKKAELNKMIKVVNQTIDELK